MSDIVIKNNDTVGVISSIIVFSDGDIVSSISGKIPVGNAITLPLPDKSYTIVVLFTPPSNLIGRDDVEVKQVTLCGKTETIEFSRTHP